MTEGKATCILCGAPLEVLQPIREPDFPVKCVRCGTYRISGRGYVVPIIPDELKPYLSAAARQASDAGSPLLVDVSNLEELAAPHKALSISQRVRQVLLFIGRQVSLPGGTPYKLVSDDVYPQADCRSKEELDTYVRHLVSKGLLEAVHNQGGIYKPTIDGWQEIEPTLRSPIESKRSFVAMWFDDELDGAFTDGFSLGIEDCGFEAYRVKSDPTNKAIIDRILSEIRQAHFVVADFTGNRQSVYYEAGFAVGLGREVISCCREDSVKSLTFDTRHLGHVVWKDAADLREKLANSIRANIIPKR